jgi:hypothetical protein
MTMTSLKFENLEISKISPSIIPSVFESIARSPAGLEVTFEFHAKMQLSYKEGEKLSLSISSQRLEPSGPSSLCGKATLYSIKQKEGKFIYLFSAGGLILRLSSPSQLEGLEVSTDYYFCIDMV